jgi:hypothetical protein
MKQAFFSVLLVLPAFAAVDGTVINATTGKPQAGVAVTLVQPSQTGMQTLGSTKTGPDGAFSFSKTAEGPQLIQATYDGVSYNKMVAPGMPSTGLHVEVYEATAKPGTAKVEQHMILVQPTGADASISESLFLQGDPKYTYNDPQNGSIRFYLPPEAKGKVRVVISAPGGMPVERPAQKTKEPNVFKVDYPVRPGETRVDLSYSLPAAQPLILSGKVIDKDSKVRLVTPNGVTAKSDDISEVGREPTTQAEIYDINKPSYKVEISGTGALQGAGSDSPAASSEDNGSPQIQEIPPRIYDTLTIGGFHLGPALYWLTGLTLTILGLGSFLLAQRAPKRELR